MSPELRELYTLVGRLPPPPEPFRFTQGQWDAIRPLLHIVQEPNYAAGGFPPLFSVPVVIVDTYEESTPYVQGWGREDAAA